MENWQPCISWEDAKLRCELIHKLRMFFYERDVIEVETPIMSSGTVTDPFLDAFTTQYTYFPDTNLNTAKTLFLQTSPEFAMKRLLASGYKSIYQICKAFRHEAYGTYHNPEFTLLEWYRIGFDHFALMDEVEVLLVKLLNTPKATRVSYKDVFLQYLNINPLESQIASLIKILQQHNLDVSWITETDTVDTLLQVIFSEVIEPRIGLDAPCFVYDFPLNQASLAKASVEDSRVAHRFECYFKGIELANGFYELSDSGEQVARFNKDNQRRSSLNKKSVDIDINFIHALESGLPNCSGVALGVDRLIMLALNKEHIKNVITFPVERA